MSLLPVGNYGKFCKPPIGSVINWSHPLANGLVAAWLFNDRGIRARNYVGKREGDLVLTGSGASSGWGNGQGIIGPGLKVSSSCCGLTAVPPKVITFSSMSFATVGRYTNYTGSYAHFLNQRGTNYWSPASIRTNALTFSWNGNSNGWNTAHGPTVPLNGDRTFIGSAISNSKQTLMVNEKRVNLTVAGSSATQTWNAGLYFGTDGFDVATRAISGEHEYGYFWLDRFLSNDDLNWLRAEPYSIFEKQRSWFVMPSSGGPFPYYYRTNLGGGFQTC